MITPARLDTFLRVMEEQSSEEWAWKQSKKGRFWIVDYQIGFPPFQFLIEYNDDMLYVQYMIKDLRVRAECWLALYRVLLRLNEELSLVKFGLTPHGNITLMGELPASFFSLDAFQNLLRLMVHCLEQNYWEIGIVAESPRLASFLTSRETYLAKLDQRIHDQIQALEVEEI